jgi:multidrug efflux pump
MEDQRGNIDELRNLKITYRDLATGGAIRQVPISAFTISGIPILIVILSTSNNAGIDLRINVIKPYNPTRLTPIY